jgi:putative SOS response-associated peptidase YedK
VGLIPFFTKELGDIKGLSTINAKAETIATARTWRAIQKAPLSCAGVSVLRMGQEGR